MKKHLRMNVSTFRSLVDRLSTNAQFQITGTKQFKLPVREQVAVALHRLATGCSLRESCLMFRLCEGTCHNAFLRTVVALSSMFDEVVVPPNTPERRALSELQFSVLHKLGGCVGIIDGTQFKMEKPADASNMSNV
jgi:hypothetical protein